MKKFHPSRLRQRGISLAELMVGIVIGILVVAVALGALMVSRKVSGTVSDSSDIQQQAAYVMRVIGQQIRQANIVRLALYPDALGLESSGEPIQDSVSPVVLVDESKRRNESWPFSHILTDAEHNGDAGLRTVFVNIDDLSNDMEKNMWIANCLGDMSPGANYSHFIFKDNGLACASSYSNQPISQSYQPVIRNVADFQIRYLMYSSTKDSDDGERKIKYMEASEVHGTDKGWDKVQGVEVCLTLFGRESITVPEDATYQGCDGRKEYQSIQSDMRKNRLHMTFRSIFQIRGQGRLTPPPTTS